MSLVRKYLAPVRIEVGLYEVWNSEHRSLVKSASRLGATPAMAGGSG